MDIPQEIELREMLVRRARAVLEAFLFGAHSTIFVSGRLDSTVLLANEAFLAALGVTRAQLIERPLTGFMSPRDRVAFEALLQSGEPCSPPTLLEWTTPEGTRRSHLSIVGVQEDTFTLIGESTASIDPSLQTTLFDLNNQLIVSNRALVQQKRELEGRTEQVER